MIDPHLDCVLAYRMTCSSPDAGGRADGADPCPLACLDDSPDARELATAAGDRLERRAAAAGLQGVVRLEAGAVADGVRQKVAAYKATHGGAAPAVVALAGVGLIVGRDTPQALAAAVGGLTGGGAAPVGRPARVPVDTRLRGCVALITGSAQGFGKGIAEALARKGAAVVIADLNEAAGRACAEELNGAHGDGVAMFVTMNVTNLASIGDGIAQAVRRFGGIDLFVSNAGVLRAGGLEEMDEASFDLVTNVNYKAYFLCAKAVVPWMRRQHALNPCHTMDIVQINSKSGLEGSQRNFAYAGGKFGAIGLTQSFALELVSDNIKVNAICPGNYFEGPLWSDPEKGLFVQYLRAGKVPGAKTVEDVKSFYMSKVPMRRGCSPDDVAAAIFYLVEQKYETGQAIAVTGGQVMLN